MQLSLRSLLMAVTGLAAIFALAVWATQDYRREQSIRHALLSLGANHVHVDIRGGRPNVRLSVDPSTATAELPNYQELDWSQIGVEGNVSPEMLAPLAHLNDLGLLHFHRSIIHDQSDLEPLRHFQDLDQLIFSYSSIRDEALDQLRGMPKLSKVIFHMTDIAPESIEDLASSLPHISFYATDGASGASSAPRVRPNANQTVNQTVNQVEHTPMTAPR